MHLDGRGGANLRVELGRGRLEAALLQGQGVAVRVKVVGQDVDGHHAVGSGEDRVGHGDGVLVERRDGRDGDAHARRGTGALAVLNRVGEGIRARRVSVRRVLDPRGLRGRRPLLRRGVQALEGHGVAVRVDAVQGHRNAGGLPGRRPRRDVAGPRRLVGVGGGQDLEGDGAGGAVARGVDDGVGDVHRAGGVPGLEAHLVSGHEGGAQGGRRVVLERRLDLQVQAGRGAVVGQDGHGADVADAHLGSVGLEDWRQVRAVGGTRDDGHLGGGRPLAVGDGVGEGHALIEARGRGHAQQVAVDEGDLEAGSGRGVDRGDRQDAARGIVIVAQGRHQHRATLRQDRGIVLGDRRQRSGLDDLDADHAQRRRDAVGDRVGEGVGTGRSSDKVDGAAVQIRRDGGASGRAGHGGQAQRVAVGIRVVLQRVEGHRLAGVGLVEVTVGRGRQVARILDVDGELTARLAALVVGDGQDHGLGAGGATLLGDGQGAVLGEGDAQPLGGLGVLQVDRITVRVAPVAQRLVLDLGTRADLDGGGAQLRGGLVLPVGVDRDLHARGGRRLPVRGLVGEGRRPGLIRAHARDLQGSSRARGGDRTPRRLGGRGRGQHVSVKVGVVVQDRQDRRAPRADAELVIHGLGRGVLLALLGVGDLVGELGTILLLLGFLELVFDLVPVVHEDHVRVGQPHAALGDVVEDDGLTVGAEDDLAGARERVDDLLPVGGGVVARAQVGARSGPGAVGAALVAHGGRGGADGRALGGRGDRGGGALEGDRHQGGGGRQENGVRLGTRLLEDAALLDSGGAQVEGAAAGQEQSVGRGVEGDDLVADDRHGQLGVGGDALDRRGLRLVDGTLALHGRQGAGGGEGVDGSVHTGHEGARAHVRGHGGAVGEGGGARGGGRGRPQCAVRRIEHAEDVSTLHDGRARGQRRRGPEGHLRNIDRGNSK